MATRTTKDEWIETNQVQLANGPGISWRHRITGARVVMPVGIHPMDNPNALALANGADQSDDAEDDAPMDDAPETPEDRVRVLLSRAGTEGRAIVKLYKVKQDKTKAFCNEYTVDEFDAGGHSMIRTHWGPGNYQILLYGNHPVSGKFARLGLENIEILGTMVPEAATNGISNFDAIMQKIDERLAQVIPAKDPRSEFAEMMRMMIMMREAFAPPPAPSMAEQIAQMSGMLNVTQQLRDMASEKETPTDPLMAMGMKAMEVIPALMAGARQNPQQNPAPQALQAPAPNARLAAPANANAPHQPQPVQNANVKENATVAPDQNQMIDAIRKVNGLAMMGMDPEKAADLIYDMAPPDLAQFLEMPDWFAQLCAMVPECAPNQQWYAALAAEYLKIDAEVQADENAADVPVHAPGPGPANA